MVCLHVTEYWGEPAWQRLHDTAPAWQRRMLYMHGESSRPVELRANHVHRKALALISRMHHDYDQKTLM